MINVEQRQIEPTGFSFDTLSIFEFFSGGNGDGTSFFASLPDFFSTIWGIYSVIAIFVSLILLAGLIYANIRLAQLSQIEMDALHAAERQWAEMHGAAAAGNDRWTDVQNHVRSENPNDWRLAIIEADIMLGDLLDEHGYVGTTIGEQLKTANPASFTTLDDAWEAHKVRNQIAHEGSDFVLTKKVAQETVVRFERVFKEFGIV